MPQFRYKPDATPRLTPEELDARTYSLLAVGLENTQVAPGEPAEITATVELSVDNEEDGGPKEKRPRVYVSGEMTSRLLACHVNEDYEEARFEFERFLARYYIPECRILFIYEFSMQPVS